MSKTLLAIALATTLGSAAQAASVLFPGTVPGIAADATGRTGAEDADGCGDPLLYKPLLGRQGTVDTGGGMGQPLLETPIVVSAASASVGQS